MGHERSRTGRTPTGAVNVYGPDAETRSRRGSVLDPIYQFERSEYKDIPTAVNAAATRSRMGNVPGWNPSLSDLLRSNPQIGSGVPVSVGEPSEIATGRRLSPVEISLLRQAAKQHGIDAGMLRALAMVEQGPRVEGPEGPTKGLGVVSVPAPTLEAQADVASRTTANTLGRYRRAFGKEPIEAREYTPDFLKYFSRGGPGYPGYAPLGATNDPTNLNQSHLHRLLQHYEPDTGIRNLSDLMPFVTGPAR